MQMHIFYNKLKILAFASMPEWLKFSVRGSKSTFRMQMTPDDTDWRGFHSFFRTDQTLSHHIF